MDITPVERVDGVPDAETTKTIDVRALAPPEPLTETMDAIADLAPGELLVQVNDRVPQHLFPRLDDHGIEYESVETEEAVLTALWRRDE